MPVSYRRCFVLVGALVLGSLALRVTAGPLNPPAGPVIATDPSLADVEPRTVIRRADVPLVIDRPGSYRLAEDLSPQVGNQVAIMIDSDNITLDLGGFSII